MLLVIVEEIRALVGKKRRVTIIFDRGGWSPKLFLKLIRSGFDILTYCKGKVEGDSRQTIPDLKEEDSGPQDILRSGRQKYPAAQREIAPEADYAVVCGRPPSDAHCDKPLRHYGCGTGIPDVRTLAAGEFPEVSSGRVRA